MSSLVEILRQRYLDTFRSINQRWKIVIVDEHTDKLIKAVLSHFEILEEGVQQIDLITNNRTPQPSLAAVYILLPTSRNIDLILSDGGANQPAAAPMSNSRGLLKKNNPPPVQAVAKPKAYGSAHLFFVDAIDDPLVSRLTTGLDGNYLQALTEIFVNFMVLESRVFSLTSPQSFLTLYNAPDRSPQDSLAQWEDEIAWMSRSIVNTLITMNEYPLIRYYNPPSTYNGPLGPGQAVKEHLTRRLADRVQRDIDAHAQNDASFPGDADNRPRGTLIITDRSMDLFAPFLHEFTYQAMCNDLLPIEHGTKYTHTFESKHGREEKEVTLDEKDKVWSEVRHMHMKDALDKLVADSKAYVGERTHHGAATELSEIQDWMASMPALQQANSQLSLHVSMASMCMELFSKKELDSVANVEQACVTGVTADGGTPKTLVEEMVPLLDGGALSSLDKLRIIAVYIMYRDGVPEGDKKRLFQHARLRLNEIDAIENLSYLGISLNKDSGRKRKPLFRHREPQDCYATSRFQPALKYMLEEHVADKLDRSIFPYIRDAPPPPTRASGQADSSTSLRRVRPNWATRGKKAANEPRQRIFVFVAGGATYSEIRATYEVSEVLNKDVFLGTSHVLTPEGFVDGLSKLDRVGSLSGADKSLQYTSLRNGSSPTPLPNNSNGLMDRRYGSSMPAPVLAPPVQQAPQQMAAASMLAPRPAPHSTQSYNPGLSPHQDQQRLHPSASMNSMHSTHAQLQPMKSFDNGAMQAQEKKKKKKLFGF